MAGFQPKKGEMSFAKSSIGFSEVKTDGILWGFFFFLSFF